MRQLTEKRPVAPSGIYSPIYPEIPQELSREEIENLIREFVEAGIRAKEAGFDGVEVHGAHTYLIGQFISPHTNKRDDEYGGDFERRMRFPSEIVKGIKKICGDDFIIGFKFSAHEHLEGGVDDDLAQKIASWMEKEGVHYIHVAATSSTIPGFLDCDYPSVPSIYSPQGALVGLAEKVKRVVDIPVIATGGITDPEYAEKILREGKADLVAIGRALIADPEWAKKARKGESIKYCIKCNTCHKRLFNKKRLKCAVNPVVGEERRFEVTRTLHPKKVVVIGGGPAGMEAAIIASKKGHDVTLYEEKDRLGGKLVYASIPQFKREISKLLEYYQKTVERCEIKLRLGQKVEKLDDIYSERPDILIIATGAVPLIPDIPGKEKVLTIIELFENKLSQIGERILIVGAGLVGCETGWYLASQGKSVKIIDILSKEEILQEEHPTNRSMLIRCMEKEKVKIMGRRKIKEVMKEGAVVVREDGTEEFIPADSVIFATGFKPETRFKEALSQERWCKDVYFIGDCVEPRKLYDAIHEGFYVGWSI
ncbi:FAD-dependent oxidoreductase [Candidatus Aerophobetes bacterium]|nr:FAD-dependent oxidoreductase [Candidatus Aerophobetes bacterium]